jgi:hypothetical protein
MEEVELIEIRLSPLTENDEKVERVENVEKKVKRSRRLQCYQFMRDYIVQLKLLVFLVIVSLYILAIYEKCRVSNDYVVNIFTKHVSNITREREFQIKPSMFSNLSSLVFVDTVMCSEIVEEFDATRRTVYYSGEFLVKENGIVLQGRGTIILKHHHVVEKTINIVCEDGKMVQFEYIEVIQVYLLITSLFMVIISLLGMLGFWNCGKTCFSQERETVRVSNIYAVSCLIFVIATAYFVITSSKDKE